MKFVGRNVRVLYHLHVQNLWPQKTVHTQGEGKTYLCTTVHTSYLKPLITSRQTEKKNWLHAVSESRNSIRLVDRQPKKHIGCGDAWTLRTIQALMWAGKHCRTPSDKNQKVQCHARLKEHRERLPAKLKFSTEHASCREILHCHRATDDLKQKRRCWHLKEKALEYNSLEKSLFKRLWAYRRTRLRNELDVFILRGWGKPRKQSGKNVASSVSCGLLNGCTAASGGIKQPTSGRLYRGCEWRE